MKYLGILIVLAVLIGGVGFFAGWWGNTSEIDVGNENTNEQMEDRTVRGTVLSINSEGIVVDKPYVITITETDGSTAVIHIPSMGLPVCVARGEIASTDTIEAGDVVEARGKVGVEGAITPCISADHYFRILSE